MTDTKFKGSVVAKTKIDGDPVIVPSVVQEHHEIRRNLDTGEVALFMGRTKYITLIPSRYENYRLIGFTHDDWHNMGTQRWVPHNDPVVLENCRNPDEYSLLNQQVEKFKDGKPMAKRWESEDCEWEFESEAKAGKSKK